MCGTFVAQCSLTWASAIVETPNYFLTGTIGARSALGRGLGAVVVVVVSATRPFCMHLFVRTLPITFPPRSRQPTQETGSAVDDNVFQQVFACRKLASQDTQVAVQRAIVVRRHWTL